jgi:hypothetical protein
MSIAMDDMKVISKFCGDNKGKVLAAMKGNYLMFQMVKAMDSKVMLNDMYLRETEDRTVIHLTENDFKE